MHPLKTEHLKVSIDAYTTNQSGDNPHTRYSNGENPGATRILYESNTLVNSKAAYCPLVIACTEGNENMS